MAQLWLKTGLWVKSNGWFLQWKSGWCKSVKLEIMKSYCWDIAPPMVNTYLIATEKRDFTKRCLQWDAQYAWWRPLGNCPRSSGMGTHTLWTSCNVLVRYRPDSCKFHYQNCFVFYLSRKQCTCFCHFYDIYRSRYCFLSTFVFFLYPFLLQYSLSTHRFASGILLSSIKLK